MWVFTRTSCGNDEIVEKMWRKHVKNVRFDTWFEIWGKVY
jgi:hypothetical protein